MKCGVNVEQIAQCNPGFMENIRWLWLHRYLLILIWYMQPNKGGFDQAELYET